MQCKTLASGACLATALTLFAAVGVRAVQDRAAQLAPPVVRPLVPPLDPVPPPAPRVVPQAVAYVDLADGTRCYRIDGAPWACVWRPSE